MVGAVSGEAVAAWRCPCGGSEDRNSVGGVATLGTLLVALPLRGQRGSQPRIGVVPRRRDRVALPLRGQRGSQPQRGAGGGRAALVALSPAREN